MFTKNTNFRKTMLGSAALLTASVGLSEIAHAQVDEIIITATKTEKSLQDVPISVSAFSAETLDNAAVTNIESLQFTVPGLNITTSSGTGFQSSIRMRGVGTSGTNLGFEGSVGIFVDGIYRPRAGTSLGDFADVERIEVLRGPQGTLFGRNTTAGAISVITKKPEFNEFNGSARATFGSHDRVQLRGILNVPLVDDQLAARFSADFNKRDGFLENVINDVDDVNDRDRLNLKGQIYWEPTDAVDARVVVNYFTADESCCGAVTFANGGFVNAGLAGLVAPLGGTSPIALDASQNDEFLTARDQPTIEEQDQVSIQFDFGLDLGGGISFFNTMSFSDYEVQGTQDSDQTGFNFTVASPNGVTETSFTEEFRFSGGLDVFGIDREGSWILGGYYSDEELGQDYQLNFGPDAAVINALLSGNAPGFPPFGFTPGDTQRSILGQDASVLALFAHLDLDLTEQFNLSGGLRYSDEKKTGSGNFTTTTGALLNPFILPGALNFEADNNFSRLTYNAALTYEWSDDVSTYASFAHGYKSGGVNLDVLGGQGGSIALTPRNIVATGFMPTGQDQILDPTFPVEEVDTFELGLKSRFWDGLATLNVTGFHSTFTDFQVLQFTGTSFNILAAPEVTTKGVEGEMLLNPAEGLDIGLQYTYADASYTEPFLLGESQLDGLTINNAPKHSAAVNATYSRPIGDNLKGFVNGIWSYESDYIASAGLEPDRVQDSYSMFMGRVGLSTADDKYGIELWCRNCTDEAVNQIIFSSPIVDDSRFAFINPPREYGVTLTSKF